MPHRNLGKDCGASWSESESESDDDDDDDKEDELELLLLSSDGVTVSIGFRAGGFVSSKKVWKVICSVEDGESSVSRRPVWPGLSEDLAKGKG